MRVSVIVAAVGLGLCLTPVLAWAGDSTVTTKTSQNDPNRIVCHSGKQVTGSLLPGSRVCKTQAQWDEERKSAQRMLNDIQTQRGMGPNGQ